MHNSRPRLRPAGRRPRLLRLVALGAALACACAPSSASPQDLEFRKGVGVRLEQLTERGEKLANSTVEQRPVSVPPQPGTNELHAPAHRIDREMAELNFAINRLRVPETPPPRHSNVRLLSHAGETYRVPLTGSVRNRSVILTNVGDEVAISPRVMVNEQRDWFDMRSILHDIIAPGMSDRAKAIAIWELLVKSRYHDAPATNGIEMHDPVRYLNVYGYGFCDDSATNFAVLAKGAGLRARVWGLSGHVVAETYFDGGWHMFDPDGEIYYLEDDNETIASVETLQRRPDLLRRYRSPIMDAEKLVRIYTTTEDNQVSQWFDVQSESTHTMRFVLRPGESLMRSWDNWGFYFAAAFLVEPKEYGNGRLTFEPILERELYRKGARSVQHLSVEREGARTALVPQLAGERGELTYDFAGPYPFLNGAVQLWGAIDGDAWLSLEFSEDGSTWLPVWKRSANGRFAERVPLWDYFRNGHGRPMYAYHLRLLLFETGTGSVAVERLRYNADFQLAPRSLPALEEGDNLVRYVDDGTSRRIEVKFEYDQTNGPSG
jgi:Transglutaminase-like superfamily